MDDGMTRETRVRRARRGGRVAGHLEALFWAGAVALLGTAAWMKADALWYQREAGAELAAERTAAPAPLAASAPSVVPAAGTPIARLLIPRLDVRAIVAEGVSDEVLRRAVGHLPGSAPIGGAGNVALAGHRDTFFRALQGIRANDRIVLEGARGGRTEYRVEWAALVEPRQVDVIEATGYPALTLVTCYPFHYVGNAPYRFVVRARRDGDDGPVLRASG